ncbi:substrate-binding domain-containing protein [Ferrimonas lipolytica]|uniref:Solute-binding protein n=1 Tax=Ferrimonas lipolytica TaxID=2724191 RepID=A0A6H1UI72_9GAMM|nr:substrate-binding domain-containing protein [Ferrimonas lipolytica]QIZ78013.1 solute-binding protein [Ferrimonas lipolytica]
MKKLRILLASAAMVLALPTVAADNVVKLATTTSTDNTGLLAYLLPEFEQQSGFQIQVIATGTGKALRHGRNGDVDVVMTHAPAAEAKFVADGYGHQPRQIMMNDFVIVGPKADPAKLNQAKDLDDAMSRIASSGSKFVSRGDESGTHMKELALWKHADITTDFTGYNAIGQGMGPALLTADQMGAYLLADRGTYLAFSNKLDSEVVFEGADKLANPYQIVLINKQRYPDLNHDGAQALSDWLITDKAQTMINDFRVNGKQLFKATYKATAE